MTLVRHVVRRVVAVGEPRFDTRFGEARAGRGPPLHRCAFVVATHPGAVKHAHRIQDAIGRHVGVDHADLVSVVEEWSAAQAHQHDERATGGGRIVLGPPRGEAMVVVVAARPNGPRVRGKQLFGALDRVPHLGGFELGVQQHEVEREVQLVAVAVETRKGLGFEHVRLSDEDARRVVALGKSAPTPEHVVHLGSARVVDRSLTHHLDVPVVVLGCRRVVA